MQTLLAVDGNSLVHRAFHARGDRVFRTDEGARCWAVKGLLSQVCAAVERSGAARVVVGFDDPQHSERRERFPGYKAQRAEKVAAIEDQLRAAVEAMRALGCAVVVPPGLEADDVLASAARWARGSGMAAVLVTSDRDSFALIDDNTRVLRIINGGVEASPMLTPERLPLAIGVRPEHYPDLAALRGDPSDNLPGVRGIGPKTGARLLTEFGSAEAVFEAAADGRCAAVVGPALQRRLADPMSRQCWAHNREVMTMRDDLALGLEGGDDGILPLPAGVVRAVFSDHGMTPGPGLRALCGIEAPPPQPQDLVTSWTPAPPRRARFPRLPVRRPDPQLTLF